MRADEDIQVQVPGAFEVADCDLRDPPLFGHELSG
jgi:hypothetical protein